MGWYESSGRNSGSDCEIFPESDCVVEQPATSGKISGSDGKSCTLHEFLKRFVFVSNDYEIDVYVNHNRDITSETAKERVQLHNLLTVRHNKAIICNDNTRLAAS